MSILTNIMESNEFKSNYVENREIYEAVDVAGVNLQQVLNSFVIANINEFVEPTIEGTIKNIKVFSEFATQQGLIEMMNIANSLVTQEDVVVESSISEYI